MKKHPFYQTLHWDELIMHKAEFVPYLDSEEDTSYFDCNSCNFTSMLLSLGGIYNLKFHKFVTRLVSGLWTLVLVSIIPLLQPVSSAREEMYDHSITDDCLPSVEDNSHHIKYFDSVNWSSADHFIALK